MSPIETRLFLTGTKSTLLQTFCFKVARLQVYVAITCYTLLDQARRGERKNSLRERTTFLCCTTLTLIYDVLSSFRLYYIQFTEIKILWGPGAQNRMWGPGSGGRITQAPIWEHDLNHWLVLYDLIICECRRWFLVLYTVDISGSWLLIVAHSKVLVGHSGSYWVIVAHSALVGHSAFR